MARTCRAYCFSSRSLRLPKTFHMAFIIQIGGARWGFYRKRWEADEKPFSERGCPTRSCISYPFSIRIILFKVLFKKKGVGNHPTPLHNSLRSLTGNLETEPYSTDLRAAQPRLQSADESPLLGPRFR